MTDTASQLGPFPTTRWSLVALAGQDEGPQRQVLGEFVKQYLPALRAHLVLGKRIAPQQAGDLLQGFLCDKVVQDRLIAKAVQGKGRFRWFLRTALDHYIVDVIRQETAQKRAPQEKRVLLPDEPAGPETRVEPSDHLDVVWARQVIQSALHQMEAECTASERPDIWGVFESRILASVDGAEPLPYDRLVERFGLASPVQAMNLLITARRMYERNLRAVIGEYVKDPGEVDAEIRDLAQILSRAHA
jgi:DNA-directed RNA polymerase specialized sigma24 family protein